MNTGNPILDGLFNNLSSIYRKDNAMLNSNLYVLLNAYAAVNGNVSLNINQTSDNTYIFSANPDALEDNFGAIINFPKPPRLNTIANGDETYRFMLAAMYKYFLSGATVATMETVLENVLSLLTLDPNTSDCLTVTNYSDLKFDATSVELTDRAVQCVSGVIIGAASASDITILPSGDIFPVSYDDSIKTVSFTGTVDTGTTYRFVYTRDNTAYNGTNWMNLTDRNAQNVSPMNLGAGYVDTYNNPEFSYWWSEYNSDGDGVVVNEFQITEEDSSLVFRLPGKSIRYKSPYTQQFVLKSYDFYNLTGTSYDITAPITPTNPDNLFSDLPVNYQEEVSGRYQNYYVRYNENNPGPSVAQSKFAGNFTKYTKKFNSVEFPSDDFGPLDFFEKNSPTGTGAPFDVNNLFGKGTKHAWINVPNINGKYTLDNTSFVPRYYSLHQDVLFYENFESDNLEYIDSTPSSGIRLSEAPGNSLEGKQNCLVLMSTSSGSTTVASPIVTGNIFAVQSGINHIEIDFYDAFNTGTSTSIDVIQTGSSATDVYKIRFGMDGYIGGSVNPSGIAISSSDITAGGLLTASAMESALLDSKSFGFVESYFSSSNSSAYAVRAVPSGLASGNTNTDYSSSSLLLNTPVGLVTPRLSNQQVIDSNYFSVEFDRETGGAMVFVLTFGTTSGYSTYQISSSDSDPNWTITHTDFDTSSSVIGTYFIDTGIPTSAGDGSIEFLRDGYLKLDGATYSGSSNPSTAVGTPYYISSMENSAGFGSDVSFITASTTPFGGSGNKIYHYVMGNSSVRDFYFSEIQYQIALVLNNQDINNSIAAFSNRPPYYYSIARNGAELDDSPKFYLSNLPRNKDWHRLTFDFGVGHSELNLSFDENVILQSLVGFSGNMLNPSGLIMRSASNNPVAEFSYFDNIELSYFDKDNLLDMYEVQVQDNDWEGSMLEQSTIVDNKFFQLEPVANFQFLVTIKGLDESFIYIVNNIIDRVKPAHTLAVPVYVLEQSLDTTSQVPETANEATDWESGNTSNNITVFTGQKAGETEDLPGFIGISGISQ